MTVTWTDNPIAIGDTVFLYARVTEVAGVATTLHSVEASATPIFSPPTPTVVKKEEPNATLSGEEGTDQIRVEIHANASAGGLGCS